MTHSQTRPKTQAVPATTHETHWGAQQTTQTSTVAAASSSAPSGSSGSRAAASAATAASSSASPSTFVDATPTRESQERDTTPSCSTEKPMKKGGKKPTQPQAAESDIPPQVTIKKDVGPDRARVARERTKRIGEKFKELQNAVASEHNDFHQCSHALGQASGTDGQLRGSIAKCDEFYNQRKEELDKATKTLRVFQAEHLEDADLEEVSDALSKGLQSATIAQSRLQMIAMSSANLHQQYGGSQQPSHGGKASFPYLYQSLPDRRFEPPRQPVRGGLTGTSPDICTELIKELEVLRETQKEDLKDYDECDKILETLLGNIKVLNDTMATKRRNLQKTETELAKAEKGIAQFKGEDDYTDLNAEQLATLCAQIKKAERKIATEMAVRQLRGEKADGVKPLSEGDTSLCIVCIERKWNTRLDPCGHCICEACSERLNFCPNCRKKIASRQRCYQP